jgi:hypothetical protein
MILCRFFQTGTQSGAVSALVGYNQSALTAPLFDQLRDR